MYVWIGCKLPQDFEDSIRQPCLELASRLGLNISGFTLPQHISLKISFDAGERYECVLDAIETLLRKSVPFYVNPSSIEQAGSILWISFRENPQLRRLHNILDRDLNRQFCIPQHLFDKAFRFHSTLFVGPEEAIRPARDALVGFPLPEQLSVDTFLLGTSESGASGTYRVVREIRL